MKLELGGTNDVYRTGKLWKALLHTLLTLESYIFINVTADFERGAPVYKKIARPRAICPFPDTTPTTDECLPFGRMICGREVASTVPIYCAIS